MRKRERQVCQSSFWITCLDVRLDQSSIFKNFHGTWSFFVYPRIFLFLFQFKVLSKPSRYKRKVKERWKTFIKIHKPFLQGIPMEIIKEDKYKVYYLVLISLLYITPLTANCKQNMFNAKRSKGEFQFKSATCVKSLIVTMKSSSALCHHQKGASIDHKFIKSISHVSV